MTRKSCFDSVGDHYILYFGDHKTIIKTQHYRNTEYAFRAHLYEANNELSYHDCRHRIEITDAGKFYYFSVTVF